MAAASAATAATSVSRTLSPRRLISARCGTIGRVGLSAAPQPDARVMNNNKLSSRCRGGHRRCPNLRTSASSSTSDDTAFTTGYAGTAWASVSEEERYEEAYDMVVRLASTLNAYDYVAFTSKSTNMGTYVYNALARIPEQYRVLLINELSDKGLINCWFIAGLLLSLIHI